MVAFIAWVVFILLEQTIKFKSHKKVCKNKNFGGMLMPSENNDILGFIQYMKSDKMTYITYADIESLIKK